MNLQLGDLAKEIIYKTSRASGAGGQNVNKVETKVTLIWDFRNSYLIDDIAKDKIGDKLNNRMNADGLLQIDSSSSRSQLTNKRLGVERLLAIIEEAIVEHKPRIATRIPRSKVLERLDRKAKQSAKKSNRRWKMDF